MIPARTIVAFLLAALAGASATVLLARAQLHAQVTASPQAAAPSASPVIRTLVLIDPAHGASDSGAVLGDHMLEKDVTLAIAARLRTALTAKGFTVVATRDADGDDPLSTDQRAEIANRSHPVACIVLHATTTGSGVHVYTSPLPQPAANPEFVAPSAFVPVPWNEAQTGFVGQSLSLAGAMGTALGRQRVPALVGTAPIRPLDNLMCPAVAIELAPLLASGASLTPVTDANYQQQVVNALAGALRAWRDTNLAATAAAAAMDRQAAAQAKALAASDAAGRAGMKVRTPPSAIGPQKTQKGPQ